jgi:lysozyme
MIKPNSRPKLAETELRKMLEPYKIDWNKYPLVIVGIRGYYKDSMGKPGENDRGIYDDAIFIVTPSLVRSFNGNTDPSKYRPGIAKLKPGIWYAYKFDIHGGKVKQYPAICQRFAPVTVIRDGKGEDSGMFGVNIHCGGENGTSSEGCQTLPPEQWSEFYNLTKDYFVGVWKDKWQEKVVPYVLMEQE